MQNVQKETKFYNVLKVVLQQMYLCLPCDIISLFVLKPQQIKNSC